MSLSQKDLVLGGARAAGVASGLTDTLSNESVVLTEEGGDVVGRTSVGGLEVFRVSVDENTGDVSMTQSRSVVHDDPADPAETGGSAAVLSAASLITLTATITDGDLDTDEDTADIGDAFKFEDDGPSITRNGVSVPMLVTDDTDIIDSAGPTSFAGLFTPDFGTDGFKDTDDDNMEDADAVTYALGVKDLGGMDVDSGLVDTLSGDIIFLFLETGDVVGRVGKDDGTANAAGDVAFEISVDENTGDVTLTQNNSVVHDDPGDPVESGLSAAMLGNADLVTLTATIEDGDGDTNDVTTDIGDAFKFEDDGPSIETSGMAAPTLTTDDTEIGMPATDTQNFAGLFTAADFGADGFKDADDNDIADDDALSYALSVNIVADDSGLVDTLTGDRILLRVNGSGEVEGYLENDDTVLAFVISVDAVGMVTQTQLRSIVHDDPTDPDETGADAETLAANIQVKLTATVIDGDLDSDSATADIGLAFQFEDDGPVIDITGGGGSVIPGLGNVGDLFVEFMSGSSDSALLGEEGGNDGVKSIEITDYSGDGDDSGNLGANGADLVVNDLTLTAQSFNNDTLIRYFLDEGVIGTYEPGIDTLFYTYELQDLIGGDGILDTAVFTVHDVPPPSMPDFSLNDLPAGQNGFGLLASRPDEDPSSPIDPDGPALIIFGRDADYDPTDGTMTNSSDTINTSKGGGPTTIGNSNQMIDPPKNNDPNGEGIFVAYVEDPVDSFVSGITDGLDQNETDDFDNMLYNGGTVEVEGAFFSVVQVQGNPKVATMQVTAFDLPADGTDGTGAQGTNLVDQLVLEGDPATRTLTPIEIDEVTVTSEDGSSVTYAIGGGDVAGAINWIDAADVAADPTIDTEEIGSVILFGIAAGDTISFKTLGDVHDAALIDGLAGKFDIGDYGLDLFNPTPDQLLSFEVTITDGDDDTFVDDHLVGIDGTGDFNDDMILLV